MKKVLLSFLIVLTICSPLFSQRNGSSYTNAIGIKALDGAGITYKHFMQSDQSLEFIGYFWDQGTRITGLYEFNFNISGANGLKWYVGPGLHLGLYNNKHGNGNFVGIDGVLGLDYKFQSAPINLSLDWQPAFESGDHRGFVGNWGGFGIRYTF